MTNEGAHGSGAGFLRRRWRLLTAGVVVLAAALVGGPFVYIHFVEGSAPKAFSLTPAGTRSSQSPGTGPATGTDNGTWTISSGSQAGYRVKETLFGQSTTAAGRTSAVTGAMTVSGLTVTAAHFTVDMTAVKSDQSGRDDQFRGRIMDVADYPTSTFTTAGPFTLAAEPAIGLVQSVTVSGTLTLHGKTRHVRAALQATRTSSGLQVAGSIPVTFSDYGIDNPSGGPASVGNSGTVEVLLDLTHS